MTESPKAAEIFTEELQKRNLSDQVFHVKALFLTSDYGGTKIKRPIVLRAITKDGSLPSDLHDVVKKRILAEVEEVATVLYDITSKPPATIDWE